MNYNPNNGEPRVYDEEPDIARTASREANGQGQSTGVVGRQVYQATQAYPHGDYYQDTRLPAPKGYASREGGRVDELALILLKNAP